MRAIVLTLATIAAAVGSDVRVDDLRFELGITPGPRSTHEDYTAGPGSTRPTGSTGWKSNSAPCADAWIGWAYADIHDDAMVYAFGVDFAAGVHSPKGLNSGQLQYQTLMPQVRVGWAHAFNTSFHFELTPFLGYGLSHVWWADGGRKDVGWGTALTYGLLAGVWGRFGHGWQIGGNFGYQGGYTTVTVDHDLTGGQSDLTMTTSGPVARAAVGYQF
jgi:hypothetical protein